MHFSFPSVFCMALTTSMGSWCSCGRSPGRAEGSAITWGADPFFPHLLSVCQGPLDNTMDNIFCPPGPLLHQGHGDVHLKSLKKATPCRAGKTCEDHQAED